MRYFLLTTGFVLLPFFSFLSLKRLKVSKHDIYSIVMSTSVWILSFRFKKFYFPSILIIPIWSSMYSNLYSDAHISRDFHWYFFWQMTFKARKKTSFQDHWMVAPHPFLISPSSTLGLTHSFEPDQTIFYLFCTLPNNTSSRSSNIKKTNYANLSTEEIFTKHLLLQHIK